MNGNVQFPLPANNHLPRTDAYSSFPINDILISYSKHPKSYLLIHLMLATLELYACISFQRAE